jgi:uncharacterized membrane protein
MDAGVATFEGIYGAERAYTTARDRDPEADWLRQSAFVEVHGDGHVVIRGTVLGRYVDVADVGDVIGDATALGAITGALLGFAFGPPAVATGLIGGATIGGAAEASHAPKLDGPGLDAIREQVPQGSSAVVVISQTEDVRAMADALASAANTFKRYRLSEAAEAELRSALADAPVAQPPNAPAS